MKQYKHWFIIAMMLAVSASLFSQQRQTDSLEAVLAKYKSVARYETDTNYINTLYELAFKYNNIKPDTTILLADHIIALCNKINYQTGKVEALKCKGLAYNVKGEYSRALDLFAEALTLAKKAGYVKGAGRLYHNIGIVYSNLGKYPEALENYFLALKMREELGDKIGIASSINAIGAIYFVQGKYSDALNNYLKALTISKEIHYMAGIESAYANIGEVNFRQGNYKDAQDNLLLSMNLTAESGNKETMAFLSNLLASVYYKQGKYKEATDACLTTKRLAAEIGSQEYVSRSSLGLGEVYLALDKKEEALLFTQDGIKIALQIGYNELLRDGNETLSRIYESKGLGMQALYHHRQFKLYADSINNQETDQRAANLAADYEYSKKEIELKAEQEKKEIEFQKQNNQQRWIIFSAFAALFSSLIVAWLIYRSRQKEKTANHLLQQQNIEIDKQRTNVETALRNLKDTQSQLIQSEKMASLGELTSGIAHEIQNPLNFVNNFSEVNAELIEELMGERSKVKSERDENLENELLNDIAENEKKINHHGKRADAIVKGMLQHSRKSSGKKELTDINAIAEEYLRLGYLGYRVKDSSFNATLKTDFDETIGNINIIPQDIGSVLLNLYNNAFYAATQPPPAGGGFKDPAYKHEPTIWVKTSKTPPPAGGGRGAEVLISVRDNGNGIPQKIVDKIFQPFFTTKPTGQGTGLGLSLSYDIVKAHGGEIKVETKDGEGSEFVIILPV